jgi:[ribosomal protein S5]-alanine N-acetyltransferase
MAATAADPLIGPAPIEGERLVLRVFAPGEAAALAGLLVDFEVVRFAGEVPWPYDPGQAASFIAQSHRHFAHGRDCVFAIERQEDGALVGCIALHADAGGHVARLGYWLGQAYWRRGYATEAIALVLAFGFTERPFARIEAEAHVGNMASWKAMARAGMMFEGIVDLEFRCRGFTAPARRYAISRKSWRERA